MQVKGKSKEKWDWQMRGNNREDKTRKNATQKEGNYRKKQERNGIRVLEMERKRKGNKAGNKRTTGAERLTITRTGAHSHRVAALGDEFISRLNEPALTFSPLKAGACGEQESDACN